MNAQQRLNVLLEEVERLASVEAAQQSVQRIGGESAPSQAESTPELNPLAEVDQLPPANR